MVPDTTARREDSVLVVVDIQQRLARVMDRRDQIESATAKLVRTAALLGVPIIVTRQYPDGLGDLSPVIAQVLSEAEAAGARVVRVDKLAFDCFGQPAFASSVAALGRRQLILAGMETHICVVQTALSGLHAGLDAHVVADACCARSDASHALALGRLQSAGVTVTTAESVMYEWVGEAGTGEFRALLGIVKG